MVFTVSLLGAQYEMNVWRKNHRVHFLCPRVRRLTGHLHFYEADRWWDLVVSLLWWPSLTKNMKKEYEVMRMHDE